MLTNIKNGIKAKKPFIIQKYKKTSLNLLNILWDNNLITGYKICCKSNKFKIFLNYKNDKSVLKQLIIISKPSKKKYFSSKQLWKFNNNIDIFLFSTIYGILTLTECKKLKVGGELICILK